MNKMAVTLALAGGLTIACSSLTARADRYDDYEAQSSARAPADPTRARPARVELGPRPEFLVNDMEDSRLKRQLQACLDDEPRHSDFSIGHRGAALQFPEHTKQAYIAGRRMGAGILADGNNGFYYQTIDPAIAREGDLMRVIDVLAKDVGVRGVFSDWAAPVSFYASCMGMK